MNEQFFEVFKGDPKSLKGRLDDMKAAGALAIMVNQTSASACYLISYDAPLLVAPAQPQ